MSNRQKLESELAISVGLFLQTNTVFRASLDGADTEPEAVVRAGHKMARHTYANAASHFLRVHDGNIVNGDDFQEHPLSLQRLRSGASAETKAIDDSARYAGWNDFVATLEAVITSELAPGVSLSDRKRVVRNALPAQVEHPGSTRRVGAGSMVRSRISRSTNVSS